MTKLPGSVIDLRNRADASSDELHNAWEKLNKNDTPALQDLHNWLEVRERFYAAQEAFETALGNFLRCGLND